MMGDADLRAVLETLDPNARDTLRRVLDPRPIRRRRDLLPADALPQPERPGLGRHHRHSDAASGGTADGCEAAWRDRGRRDILISGLSTRAHRSAVSLRS